MGLYIIILFFIPFLLLYFAEICEPLPQMLKADVVWNWTTACQRSFELQETMMVSPPVLKQFDANARLSRPRPSAAVGACPSQLHQCE